MTPSLTKELFRKYLASGHTHLEALHEFDPEVFRKAVSEELYEWEDACHDPESLFALARTAWQEEGEEEPFAQATELWLAGWTSEQPFPSCTQMMSLYWRAPAKGKRTMGRRYLSTNQAWNTLRKIQNAAAMAHQWGGFRQANAQTHTQEGRELRPAKDF